MLASHSTRFFESVLTSRVLQHVSETLESLSSVRAYGVVDRFTNHFSRLADSNMRAFVAFQTCYRFVRALSGATGLAIMVATLVFAVLVPAASEEGANPSSVGLALSASLSVSVISLAI